jgi:hypothetical protein
LGTLMKGLSILYSSRVGGPSLFGLLPSPITMYPFGTEALSQGLPERDREQSCDDDFSRQEGLGMICFTADTQYLSCSIIPFLIRAFLPWRYSFIRSCTQCRWKTWLYRATQAAGETVNGLGNLHQRGL